MSKKNIYDEIIISFLKRIGFLQGAIFHLKSDIKGFEESYKKTREASKNIDFRLGTKLVISDVSGETDKGFLFFYPAFGGYTIKLSDYKKFNDRLINEFASFALLQSYEAFRSFLKKILADYYHQHKNEVFDHKLIREKRNILNWILHRTRSKYDNLTHDMIMTSLNRNPGKHDSQYFRYLRKISDHYRNFESTNNRDLDFREFHKVFALCRHAITHTNSILQEPEIKDLSSKQVKILDFLADEKVPGGRKIFLNQEKTSKLLVAICEHAFLVYKSISLKEGFEWKILKNMK